VCVCVFVSVCVCVRGQVGRGAWCDGRALPCVGACPVRKNNNLSSESGEAAASLSFHHGAGPPRRPGPLLLPGGRGGGVRHAHAHHSPLPDDGRRGAGMREREEKRDVPDGAFCVVSLPPCALSQRPHHAPPIAGHPLQARPETVACRSASGRGRVQRARVVGWGCVRVTMTRRPRSLSFVLSRPNLATAHPPSGRPARRVRRVGRPLAAPGHAGRLLCLEGQRPAPGGGRTLRRRPLPHQRPRLFTAGRPQGRPLAPAPGPGGGGGGCRLGHRDLGGFPLRG